jgi:5-methylcytosine-specific restriction endonuclease McrA
MLMARNFAIRFYSSKAWRQARALALRRDMFTCRDCGGRANEVHHIVELQPENINDPAIALGLDNLTSLCTACHSARTAGACDLGDGYAFDADGQVVRSGG